MTGRRRSERFAEYILSLTMPSEHARAAVGDLTETAGGPFRFWVQIVRTAAAFTWRGVVADWQELALDAVVGWCVWGIVFVLLDLAMDWWQLYQHPFLLQYYFLIRVRIFWMTDGAFRWWGWALWLNNNPDRRLAGMAVSALVYALLSSLTGVAFIAPSLLGAAGWLGAAYIHLAIRRRRLARD